jgi:hypothetical protein
MPVLFPILLLAESLTDRLSVRLVVNDLLQYDAPLRLATRDLFSLVGDPASGGVDILLLYWLGGLRGGNPYNQNEADDESDSDNGWDKNITFPIFYFLANVLIPDELKNQHRPSPSNKIAG